MTPASRVPQLVAAIHPAVVVCLLAGLAGAGCRRTPPSAPRASGPLGHQVYVWQRHWGAPVRAAVAAHGPAFERVVVLAAELSWEGAQPRIAQAAVHYGTLVASGRRVGLAVRLAVPPGDPAAALEPLCRAFRAARERLQAAGGVAAELQLDADMPTARIPAYAAMVRELARQLTPGPVTVTLLPAWIGAPGFADLLAAAPGSVLQVHSVEPPRERGRPPTLFDAGRARGWVEGAARVGQPFRVALPTYGYDAGLSPDGRLVGLRAEALGRPWPDRTTVRTVMADPAEVSGFLQSLVRDRPAALAGVLWYRLPVSADRLAWRWPTLAAVLAGRALAARLEVVVAASGSGLYEVALRNGGDRDATLAGSVRVTWRGALALAADALAGFGLGPAQENGRAFLPEGPMRIPAGDRRPVGWIRLDRVVEVTGDVQQ